MPELPPLPLDETTRKTLAFCLFFKEKAGFFAVYEQQLALIWTSSRKKWGLKTRAYELTEQLYQQYLEGGRCFADRDNFFDEYSKHSRRAMAKV